MIYVDDRTGSKELMKLLPANIATLTRLEYGDFMIHGHGDTGDVLVGIERKTIGDFINSMCSGRFSGRQLIGMMNSYHYRYLVIEGIFRANPRTGVLETWKHGGFSEHRAGRRRFMARDIWAFMNTVQIICGFHCYHTSRDTDTAYYLMALHHWWGKEYAEHRGHLQQHTGPVVELSKQTLVRRVASCLDGVGWEKSRAIDQKFKSVAELVNADEGELMEVDGIGKKLCNSILTELWGG